HAAPLHPTRPVCRAARPPAPRPGARADGRSITTTRWRADRPAARRSRPRAPAPGYPARPRGIHRAPLRPRSRRAARSPPPRPAAARRPAPRRLLPPATAPMPPRGPPGPHPPPPPWRSQPSPAGGGVVGDLRDRGHEQRVVVEGRRAFETHAQAPGEPPVHDVHVVEHLDVVAHEPDGNDQK